MEIKNTRIAQRLTEMFNGYIDMSDNPGAPLHTFYSRALASLAVMMHANIKEDTAAQCVTDGFNDLGIDAIFIDESRLLLIQSKWVEDGNSSPDLGSVLKFLNGAEQIMNLDFLNANAKIKSKQADIEKAIRKMEVKITLVLIFAGKQTLSQDCEIAILKLRKNTDDGNGEIIDHMVYNQTALYNYLLDGQGNHIINDEDVVIENWGKIDEPYTAYYGTMSVMKLVEWYKEHQHFLFEKNIRLFKGSTEVNEGIKSVLKSEPENFFYYNNGVKVLCKKITRKAESSTTNKVGFFNIQGINIVNGAQTTGAIYEAYQENPDQVKRAKIIVQFIGLESTPDGYDIQVTKLSNTQNRIENKDFASLDSQQERLRGELLFSHIGDRPELCVNLQAVIG